jgi:hypothetical protein
LNKISKGKSCVGHKLPSVLTKYCKARRLVHARAWLFDLESLGFGLESFGLGLESFGLGLESFGFGGTGV